MDNGIYERKTNLMKRVFIILSILMLMAVCLGDEATSHLRPVADATLDLGSAVKRWRKLYTVGITDNTAIWDNSTLSGFTSISADDFLGDITAIDITATTVTATTLTDGTTSITGGNYTNVGNITGLDVDISAGSGNITTSKKVTATTLTDRITTITGGNYTGVGNITGSDVDISAGSGSYSSTGVMTAAQITLGTTLIISDASITDLSGDINFSLTNFMDVGTIGSQAITVTDPANQFAIRLERAGNIGIEFVDDTIGDAADYLIRARNGNLEIRDQTAGVVRFTLDSSGHFNFASGNLTSLGIGNFGSAIIGGTTPVSLFEVDGAQGLAIETVTGNTTLNNTHSTLLVNASGNVTISLPAAAGAYNNTDNIGRIYEVKKIDADADTVILDGNGAELIDGAATAVITVQWESITFQSNGTGWYII